MMKTSKWTRRLAATLALFAGLTGCGPETESPVADEPAQLEQPVDVVTCSGGPCWQSTGAFDILHLSQRWATGWVCNPNYPTTTFKVLVQKYVYDYSAGQWIWYTIGSGYANATREAAVANLCGGNSYHGFYITNLNTSGAGTYRIRAFVPYPGPSLREVFRSPPTHTYN